MIAIALVGAGGRMGCALARCIARAADLRLAGAVESAESPLLGSDAGTVAGIAPLGVALTADIDAAMADAGAVVDFSASEALGASMSAALERGIPMVIGVTGLDAGMAAAVRRAAQRIPIVQAANMSTGLNVLLELTARAAAVLGADYDIEIVETHHRHKKDAPSGTALALAAAAAGGRRQDLEAAAVYGRRGIPGPRPRGEIGIHALRGGDVVGEHTVHFAADGEKLEFTHRASNREAFALGALRAVRWVLERPAGLYDMRDVLGLRDPD